MSTSVSISYRYSYPTADNSLETKKYGPTYIISSETQADLIPNGAEIEATIRKHNLQRSVANVASTFLKADQYKTTPSLQMQLIDKGFGCAEWALNHSFENLMEELGTCKYLYAYGYFAIGNYKKLGPKTKFHEKEVVFLDKFDTNPFLQINQLKKQPIVIVGAIEETEEGKVLYIDPTKVAEYPTIYGIDYTEFCKYILPLHQDNQGVNSCFLLKRQSTMLPSIVPSTPRKASTPRKFIEQKALTTENPSRVFKACDLKPHHISALGLLLCQYDQKAQENASALNKCFNKYWINEEKIKADETHLKMMIVFFKNNRIISFNQQIKSYVAVYNPKQYIVNFLQDCSELKKDPQEHLDTAVKSWHLDNYKNLMLDLGYNISQLPSGIEKIPPEQMLLKLKEQFSNALMADFGLKIVPFNPLTQFKDFKNEVISKNYIYAFGYFDKKNWTLQKIQTYKDKQVVCLEGDTIKNKQMSSIVIFGYVDSEESIFFINPEDNTTNKTIYKLDYTTFCDLVRPISDDVDCESSSYLLNYQGT